MKRDYEQAKLKKVTPANKRAMMIAILDEHDAWEHVAMHYIDNVVNHSGFIRFRKDGTLNKSCKPAKLVIDLNHIVLDDAMCVTDPKQRREMSR